MATIPMIDLKTAILEEFATANRELNKFNLIGRNPGERGPLEHRLGLTFDIAQRGQAGRAFDELKRDDFIRSTYKDPVDPENWMQITDAGKNALKRRPLLVDILNPGVGSSTFGIPNHLTFQEDLKSLAANDKPISVLFLDLDNFKSVNDNHDHTVGDQVISEVIALVLRVLENKGKLYHRSGDEMIVLLENFDHDEAFSVGERIRKTVAEHELPTIGKNVITATIGVATCPAEDLETLDELERLADKTAMQAKKLGKNRTLHHCSLSGFSSSPNQSLGIGFMHGAAKIRSPLD